VSVEHAAGLTERAVHRGHEVLVGLGGRRVAPHHQRLAGHGDLDAHAEVLPEPLVALRQLQRDGAAGDAVVVALQVRRLLPDQRVHRVHGVEVAPGDLQRDVHVVLRWLEAPPA
jgi:hypothetical protein